METTTELKAAKEWLLEELKASESVNILHKHGISYTSIESLAYITDQNYLDIFRKEVIEPWLNPIHPNEISSLFEKHKGADLDALHTYEERAFFLYSKEVLEKQTETDGCDPWLNQYDYDQIEDDIRAGKSKFVKFVTAIAESDSHSKTDVNDTEEVKTERQKIISLINEYWRFDNYQEPRSTWHEKNDLIDAIEKLPNSESDLIGKLKGAEFNLSNYNMIGDSDLRQISDIYGRIKGLIMRTDSVHEDIIEFMIKPFSDILQHHGININEQNF